MNPTTVVIIFIVALIFSIGFLLVILTLVPAINQFKSLIADMEKTSFQVRELSKKLSDLTEKVETDLDKIDSMIDSSKETVEAFSHTFSFLNKNFFKQSAGLLAFIPAIKVGYNLVKKIKGGK
jgi:predicted PurR-regulated permease PerM